MQRFVPLASSLTDNAPGYNIISTDVAEAELGPLCWKCSGTGSVTKKVSLVECKVCRGKKRLPVKSDVQRAKSVPGVITRQTLPPGWVPKGPRCFHGATPADELPTDLSLQDGEQMCVFVGDWRILQRKGGHRRTTDDIVTGWVAGKQSTVGTLQYNFRFRTAHSGLGMRQRVCATDGCLAVPRSSVFWNGSEKRGGRAGTEKY